MEAPAVHPTWFSATVPSALPSALDCFYLSLSAKTSLPLLTLPEAKDSINIIASASHRSMTSFRNSPCHRQDEKAQLGGNNLPWVRT